MPKMNNLDKMQLEKAEIMNKIKEAIDKGDDEGLKQAFDGMLNMLQENVMKEAREMQESNDVNVLAGRGVRQLTSNENKYYQGVIEAMKSSNPKQALTDLDIVMPDTVIESVFEDLKGNHPLLEVISFQNTSGLVEFLANKHGKQLAKWGILTSHITEELSSGFKKINLTLNKLSAFLPIAKSMLDLGAKWLDRYVRDVLYEALAFGLEEGIINGTGKNEPIGMNRQVGEDVTTTGGVYPLKETVVIDGLDPINYGQIISKLVETPNGNTRVVNEVILIINPVDYFTRIMAATTIRGANGTYINNVFPFPTKLIQSVQVPKGKAIIGIAKKYFMGIGTAKSGKLEYSDEYKFLEDERIYLIKLYGHGEPLDNNAFVYLDISNLQPAYHKVFIANAKDEPIPIYESFDARLEDLDLGSASLSPAFNKSTHSYTATTTNATNTITAIPVDDEATVEILVNGSAIANAAQATWNDGENTVVINITSGTDTESYSILVTKS